MLTEVHLQQLNVLLIEDMYIARTLHTVFFRYFDLDSYGEERDPTKPRKSHNTNNPQLINTASYIFVYKTMNTTRWFKSHRSNHSYCR